MFRHPRPQALLYHRESVQERTRRRPLPGTMHDAMRRARSRVVELEEELSQRRRELIEMSTTLESRCRRLEELTREDPLTGLYNRRFWGERYKNELARAKRYAHPLCVLLLDLDHFKAVNDKHGHIVGDEVLKQSAQTLLAHTRETDIVARYGGEEFVVVLPETDAAGAQVVAERLRAAIEALNPRDRQQRPFRVSTSIGLAAYNPSLSAEALLQQADDALYLAKRAGRNRVTVWQQNRPQHCNVEVNSS